MGTKAQRTFALMGALLFFGTSVAASGFVIWQLVNGEEKPTVTQTTADQTNEQQEDVLEGTKLADFTPVAKTEQLKVTDITVGTGPEATAGATVTAHYTGAVAADGIIFQSSHDFGEPATFPLSNVIKGWQDGVPGMKVGGKRRLLIPAVLAYGENPPAGSNIPPNADLVFDIELISVE
jgi:FKBP-type peptidyl-prolyl cis-trans isomerase